MTDISRSTDILTEHLGYAPIALIDDIINAVNTIMYKCTSAMESFMSSKFAKDSANAIKYKIPEDEIAVGTAKLETLLESMVDRSFDKFELYVLRNLLVIPSDLIEGGWIRLKHHENVDFSADSRYEHGDGIDDEIVYIEKQLLMQKAKNELLKARILASSQDVQLIQQYNEHLKFLSNGDHGHLLEIMDFLVDEVSRIVDKINEIQESLSGAPLQHQPAVDSRGQYIDQFTSRAILRLGLGEQDHETESQAHGSGEQRNDKIRSIISSI